jgi:hypothetical protein
MVSGLRSAPVRVIIRDDATSPEILETLKAAKASLDARLDNLPTGGGSGGYVS